MRFASLLVVALAAGLWAQDTPLKLGKTVQGDLQSGQTRSYSVRLKDHQYAHAVVTQPFAVVTIELYGPDGKKSLELRKPGRIVWVSEAAGNYRISVSGSGHYEVTLRELRKAGPDDRKRADAGRLLTQASGEARKSAYDQAILSYTRAGELYREIHDREGEEDALIGEGNADNYIGQIEKAIGCSEQALAISRDIKDRNAEGAALSNLGVAYNKISQSEKAIGYDEQARAIFRELKDRDAEAITLGNLGSASANLSRYDQAIGYLEQALAIFREVKDRNNEGTALSALGNIHIYLSQSEKAIGYLEQALEIAREVKDRFGEGNILLQLGAAYDDLGQYGKAIGYLKQALPIERDLKDRVGESWSLIHIGGIYSSVRDYGNAIRCWEEALAIAREIEDRRTQGAALSALGYGYAMQKQYEKAIGNYEQALALAHDVKDRQTESAVLSALGFAFGSLGQYEKAASRFEQGLEISRQVRDRRDEADEESGLMDVWRASGKPGLAVFFGKQAVNTLQSIRSDISGLGQDLQLSFLKVHQYPYNRLAGILIEQGRLAEAEQVLALLKEEEYFQYVRRDAGDAVSLNRRAGLTPEEAESEKRYREIGDRLMAIGAERGELLARKTRTTQESERLVQLEQDLTAGDLAFEQFLDGLTRNFSAKPEMKGRVDAWRETQGIMEDLRELPAGTVAIYTLIADDKLYSILRSSDAEKKYEYPIKSADLNRKINDFRAVIQDPKLDPRPLAHELYQILVAGMADDLRQAKAQTLMWSLDGALRYVPLAALYDGKQYLVEQYRVSVMTLASNARLKDRPDAEWKAAGFGVTQGSADAAALPAVAEELSGIFKILGGEITLDDQFTQQSMRQMLLKRYPVVHIASHFHFEPGDDTKSFLLLGAGQRLSLAELKKSPNLFGGVQLLTLSACNTSVGDGAEVEGFGTLAQRQGAKAVLASLWPVADESTSRLMQGFYRIRESSARITKLEALREAQLALLRGGLPSAATGDGDRAAIPAAPSAGRPHPAAPAFPFNANAPYAHPYYWAPFFLMGNWL